MALLEQQQYDEVFEALRTIVSETLRVPAESVTAASRITDLAHVESITLLRIAGKIERRFGIEIDNETIFRDGSLADVVQEIIASRQRAAV